MKSLLLYANDDTGFEARLQAALDVARAFGSHITCLTITPYDAFILGDPFGGIYAMPIIIDELREAEQQHRSRVEEKLGREGVSWDWQHLDGQPARVVVDQSRLADLVILSLPPEGGAPSSGPLSLTADVSVHARSPVLAVPVKMKSFDCSGPALIAWNGSAEAAHALRLALPILKLASTVQIVTVKDEGSDFPSTHACKYLAEHGVKAELEEWSREGDSVEATLRDAASEIGASYIVMGAYGHSRIREAVLGGTTRMMLDHSHVPLLLGH